MLRVNDPVRGRAYKQVSKQKHAMPPPKFNKFTNTKTGKLKKITNSTIASPPPSLAVVAAPTEDESQQQFEVEICWCVQQFEKNLEAPNLTPKQGRSCPNIAVLD